MPRIPDAELLQQAMREINEARTHLTGAMMEREQDPRAAEYAIRWCLGNMKAAHAILMERKPHRVPGDPPKADGSNGL